MSRLNIPIDMLTSRLNLGERFEGVRSQSLAQRFSNLKPIGEFFDLKRLSKPRDFADIQARVNYNLGYFSSNYAVVFVMLSIYALLTNTWLLFDIVFVTASMWIVGRLGGSDLQIGTFRATTSQLYTGIACISIPIAIFAGPIGTFLWLIGASGTNRDFFFRGGGLGGRPRTPYDVPRWGRPPGARLGRNRGGHGGYGAHQSWSGSANDDERFQELGTEDEDGFLRPDLRYAYDDDGRFHSDELLFDGLDYSNGRHMRHRRRSDDPYYDGLEFSEYEDYYADYPLRREGSQHNMHIEKEEDLVARALERIARARALGKTNIKLSQPEIDALERLERSKVQQRVSQPPAKSSPASKKAGKQKTIEAGKKKRSDSPKARPVEGRVRNRSNASSRSARDDRDELVSYPLPQDPDYGYISRATDPRAVPYQGSPLRPGGSRSNSSSNIRQVGGGSPMYAPYYQGQRYVSMPEGPYHRRGESNQSRLRADSALSGSRSRSGSNANIRDIPLDQLPNPTQAGRAPRFDPLDPRYASPGRRVVSGPHAGYGPPPPQPGISRRQSDDMFLQDDTEVLSYMVSSSSRSNSDSDGSYYDRPVEVNVQEKPGTKTGYAIKTRSAAAASGSKSASKSNAKASIRRR